MRRLAPQLGLLGLVAAIVLVVAGRAVLADWPIYPDEAGFFLVARETFHGTGEGLYGGYWVDRPPTLIWLFGIAAAFDDVQVIRWVATVLLVGFVSALWAAGRVIGGARPATAAALVGAAFVTSPLLGAEAANGEVLAVPFVAAGAWCVLQAFGDTARRPTLWALAAGGFGMVALTIKQNFADVFVLAALLALAQLLWRQRTWRTVLARLAAGVLGALAWLAIVLAWVLVRGAGLADFWEVCVSFRAEASGVLQGSHTSGIEERREILSQVVQDAWLVPLLVVLLVLFVVGRLGFSPVVLAVAGMLGFEAWCIVAGGSWWTHYLIGLAPGLALAVAVALGPDGRSLGPLLGRTRDEGEAPTWLVAVDHVPRFALGLVAIVFVWTQVSALPDVDDTIAARGIDNAQAIGGAIADAAQEGDTLTVMYGAADLQWSSTLPSPYVHLWSLPVRVLDPDLADLRELLASTERPTFLVVTLGVNAFGLDPDGTTAALLAEHYTLLDKPCGQALWVRDDVRRTVADVRC